MALVGPRVLNYLTESKAKAAKIQIESFASALDLYFLDTGRYPSSSEGLAALVQRPGSIAAWNGPYLKGGVVPADPWGNALCLSLARAGTVPMTSSPTARMGRKVERDRRPTSPAGRADARATRATGFTLLEIVCVVAIIGDPRGDPAAALSARHVARAARSLRDRGGGAAQGRPQRGDAAPQSQIATEVDAPARIGPLRRDRARRPRAGGRRFDALLAARCNQRPARADIRFFASGMSCGGVIALTRLGRRLRGARQLADRRGRGCCDRRILAQARAMRRASP